MKSNKNSVHDFLDTLIKAGYNAGPDAPQTEAVEAAYSSIKMAESKDQALDLLKADVNNANHRTIYARRMGDSNHAAYNHEVATTLALIRAFLRDKVDW
jgi:hypothetical protein